MILATSLPASGSVIAMHVLFLPVKKSGRKRSCSSGLPNLRIGGMPNANPAVSDVPGPARPVRDSYQSGISIY